MAKHLILEIGIEELPAGFIPGALSSLERLFRKGLEEKRLTFKGLRTLGTPRRLTVIVEGLDEKQKDATREAKGPALKAAFDSKGAPTNALLGFARSQGVKVEQLKTVKTEKGEYLFAIKKVKGERTKKILPETLKAIVSSVSFPKAMRWSDHEVSFCAGQTMRSALQGPYTGYSPFTEGSPCASTSDT
jgi:glycyl-tRNA synthetase beta chain